MCLCFVNDTLLGMSAKGIEPGNASTLNAVRFIVARVYLFMQKALPLSRLSTLNISICVEIKKKK